MVLSLGGGRGEVPDWSWEERVDWELSDVSSRGGLWGDLDGGGIDDVSCEG